MGTVNVSTLRTWVCEEDNALAILRMTQNIHGGDLVFDNGNKIVHLLTFSGKESGALFAYRKNLNSIKRVVDTRSLVTRLYAYGKDGMTFAMINGGREYVEDFTYSSEVRVSTLDCSNFTNPYRAVSITYYAAKIWAEGGYNFTGDAPPQPFIPWLAYWDDYDQVPWMLPHVYDYVEGGDAASRESPIISETYKL